LLCERTTGNITQIENKTLSISPTEQNHLDKDIISKHINLEISSDKHTTDLNTEHTSIHISKLPDRQTISSPVKLISLPELNPFPERKPSQENMSTMHINDPSETTFAISSSIVHPPMIKPSPSERKVIVISFFKFIHL
jgi:hypothetical protein